MADAPHGRAAIRVVAGEISSGAATSRMVVPSAGTPAWPPFRRVGEVIATKGRESPAHGHQGEEVLTYVVEGLASYGFEGEPPEPIGAGSVRLLSAPTRSVHRISSARGGPIRWFVMVVGLGPKASGPVRLQKAIAATPPPQAEGAIVRPIAGGDASVTTTTGLEAREYRFVEPGTVFAAVGHDRRGIVYSIDGVGAVDGRALEVGEAALVEQSSGVAIHGEPGFRAILSTAPAPTV